MVNLKYLRSFYKNHFLLIITGSLQEIKENYYLKFFRIYAHFKTGLSVKSLGFSLLYIIRLVAFYVHCSALLKEQWMPELRFLLF